MTTVTVTFGATRIAGGELEAWAETAVAGGVLEEPLAPAKVVTVDLHGSRFSTSEEHS
jgi:hypothetical protein